MTPTTLTLMAFVLFAVTLGQILHEATHALTARLLGSSDVRIAWREQTTYFTPIDPRRDRYVQIAPLVVSIVMLPFVAASIAIYDSLWILALVGFWLRYSWTSKTDLFGVRGNESVENV